MEIPNITLRELEKTDLPVLTAWRSDPERVGLLGAGFRYVGTSADEAWYAGYLANRSNNVRLAICAPEGTMVGVVYLLHIDWVSRDAEFAIWIGEPAERGKSYGKRAMQQTISHAFEDLNLERLHLAVLVHNKRAIGLYRKLGFRDEGVLRRAAYKRGAHHDLLLMGLLRTEYVRRAS